jgi:hypothetical protein
MRSPGAMARPQGKQWDEQPGDRDREHQADLHTICTFGGGVEVLGGPNDPGSLATLRSRSSRKAGAAAWHRNPTIARREPRVRTRDGVP